MKIGDLCAELRNWFDIGRRFDTFTISGGNIDLSGFVQSGQYFRIIGSVFNDGVYQYPVSGLTDETFDGAVWAMAVPKDVLALLTDITNWETKYGDIVTSPYVSESFGGYSYSKASANSGNADKVASWQSTFANRLNKWRKL